VAPRVYVAGSTGVVPPVPISKSLPPFPRNNAVVIPRNHVGVLDIVINTEGNVSEVTVRKSVHPQYDKKLVETVRTWKFRPATKDGQPVNFRSVFEVKLAQ
jgi:TonB family protein